MAHSKACLRYTAVSETPSHHLLRDVLAEYPVTSGLQFCFEAVFPLFAFTHRDLGGLSLTVSVPMGRLIEEKVEAFAANDCRLNRSA